MKAFQLSIAGSWGHFRKPETNNNPLTHDFITKTALVGLIGAVLGIEREEMQELFPQLCDNLLYGVRLLKVVKKESHAFLVRNADRPGRTRKGSDRLLKPKHFEFLKEPHFLVAVALRGERSEEIFEAFIGAVEHGEAVFTPVLGLHNCPADLSLLSSGTFSERQEGAFEAKCFVSSDRHEIKGGKSVRPFHVSLDRIPTFQKNFWNPPDRYQNVVYPYGDHALSVAGEFFEYTNGEQWWLT